MSYAALFGHWPDAHSVKERIAMLKHIPLILLLMLSACSDKSSSPTVQTPMPAPIAQAVPAVLNIVQPSVGEICISPVRGFKYRLTIPFTVMETAGTGLAVNFINADFFRGGQRVERQSIGSNDIIATLGTNRIEGNSSISATITFDFNSDDVLIQITLNYTDDSGIRNSYSSPNVNVNVRPICILAASKGT